MSGDSLHLSPVAAGFGQGARDLFGRQSPDMGGCASVHHKGQGAQGPMLTLDADPARDAVLRLDGELTPKKLSELRP